MSYYLTAAALAAVIIVGYRHWLVRRHEYLSARVLAARTALVNQRIERGRYLILFIDSLQMEPDLVSLAHHSVQTAEQAWSKLAQTPISYPMDAVIAAENDLSSVLRRQSLPPDEENNNLLARSQLARHIYNDAVRDYRALRFRKTARLLLMSIRTPMPPYFDVDDVSWNTQSMALEPPSATA